MKNKRSGLTQSPCQVIHANRGIYLLLISRYVQNPIQQEEILESIDKRFSAMSDEQLAAIVRLPAYMAQSIKFEAIAYAKKNQQLNAKSLDDHVGDAEFNLHSEEQFEIQRSEMTDAFIDHHREIKEMLSEDEYELLHQWGVLDKAYTELMEFFDLTEPQVRMRIYHLRQRIKSCIKKFW